jgi:D-alanyl-D-alanine endopeptidase (penicillin-binding protein 7)
MLNSLALVLGFATLQALPHQFASKGCQMFKLALAVVISLFLVLEPASAAGAGAGKEEARKSQPVRKAVKKKVRRKRNDNAVVVTKDTRQRLVRRVEVVRGKRKVTYYNPNKAAAAAVPVVMRQTVGDMAGLHRTRDPLSLKSSVALAIDQTSAEVLFEKNANVALPIASITKLMTGLVVVTARQDMNEVLTVEEADVDRAKFSSSRLRVGSRMARGDLLHIALMSSENRAAAALGRNYPGGIQAFVAAMNAKARELGMHDTHYVDSSGLSSSNISSARDLARLVKVAYGEALLREYSTDPKSIVEASGRPMMFSNTNYLVALPDWNIGLQKTGFINEAGRCLVMQATIQGRPVIMVFLDSKGRMSRTADAGRMRRWLESSKPAMMAAAPVAPAATAAPATLSTVSATGAVH